MREDINLLEVYERFLGMRKQRVPRKRRCHLCYKPYFVVMNNKGICRKCDDDNQALLFKNIHKDSLF